MLEQFLNQIEKTSLIYSGQKVLIAVSGGIDSMVLLALFRQSSFPISVAHCNFQLRGAASDGDEEFVKEICERHQLPFYSKRFSTQHYADEQGISIQMAARDLRYTWFKELLTEQNIDLLATAHHLNDNLETVLLHLVRGTGLDGLAGIPLRNGNIIRPLLGFTKASIEEYANSQSIHWRDDVSNQSDYYDRNFIRQQVVPLLKKINPSLEDGFRLSNERLIGAQSLVTQQIEELNKEVVQVAGGVKKINIDSLLSTGSPATVLWYLIKEYGFQFDQCKKIIEPHETGASFYSKAFRVTIDRGYFIITERKGGVHKKVSITADQSTAQLGSKELVMERLKGVAVIERDPTIAQLDLSTLEFPLCWRVWEPGDVFVPLGMQQHKKISDFLIDQKVPLPEKQNITVLESNGEICWVVGHRVSDLFKVKPTTKTVFIIRNIR